MRHADQHAHRPVTYAAAPTRLVPGVLGRVQISKEVYHRHHILGHRVRHERGMPLELNHNAARGASRRQAVRQAQVAEKLESLR